MDSLRTATLLLGTVFAISGATKLQHPTSFLIDLGEYGLLAARAIPIVGWLVMLAELATGLALLAGVLIPIVSTAAALMLMLFSGAAASALSRGKRPSSCGCFGKALSAELHWGVVARNLLLLASAAYVSLASDRAMLRPPELSLQTLSELAGAGVAIMVVLVSAYSVAIVRVRE
jgi:uncharacterized membrane protein YphA (DoxX/SURF4 family)